MADWRPGRTGPDAWPRGAALLPLVALVAAVACGSSPVVAAQESAASCEPEGDVTFVCGLAAPEDLVVVPGGEWVVASSYGGDGGLYLVRTSDAAVVRAYPSPQGSTRAAPSLYGDCPGPPETGAFQTHGLYLREGTGGLHHLFVVAHGGRESIEVFEVDTRGSLPELVWMGCVVAPDPIGLNSVRALPGGGFAATNFLTRGQPENRERLMAGGNNGELWEWQQDTGWRMIPGSESSGPNGIELSADGRTFYVAAWGSQSFFRLSRGRTPGEREEVQLGFRVDNIRWARDGSILAAGQGGEPGAQYTVLVTIDPGTLAVREVLRHPNTDAFGAGTVAVEVGDSYWVGSFRGDRIAIFPAR